MGEWDGKERGRRGLGVADEGEMGAGPEERTAAVRQGRERMGPIAPRAGVRLSAACDPNL